MSLFMRSLIIGLASLVLLSISLYSLYFWYYDFDTDVHTAKHVAFMVYGTIGPLGAFYCLMMSWRDYCKRCEKSIYDC